VRKTEKLDISARLSVRRRKAADRESKIPKFECDFAGETRARGNPSLERTVRILAYPV